MTARNSVLTAIAAAGCIVATASAASAQSYPQHPVKIIVDRPAGVPHDIVTRAMADKLSASLKQTFVVDNRTGAGGNLATEFVARSAPDGYTLLVALDTTLTVNPIALQEPVLRSASGFAAVVDHGEGQHHAGRASIHSGQFRGRARRLCQEESRDLCAWRQRQPGASGHGVFPNACGIPATPVPYRGNAQLVTDLVAGQIKFGFVGASFLFDMSARGV